MRYLITTDTEEPYYTDDFDPDTDYIDGMVVYDLKYGEYTTDGEFWSITEIK